jgi:hypothetical protein
MPDEIEVKGVVVLGCDQRFELVVSLLTGYLRTDDAKPPAHTVDVGVNREGRLAQREE